MQPKPLSRWGSLLIAIMMVIEAPAVLSAAPTVSTAEVDKLFAEWSKPDSPGCALSVIRDGQIVYKRGYGMADLEHGVPITPGTIFHVASVSKQFTVMATIMLAMEGKLSLDDDIRKHIPETADFGAPITIRHLIHHTSGLRDQWELLQYAGWRNEDVVLQQDVLNLLFKQKELNFTPGERYLYSNSGYTLMAVLVERLSGKPLPEFCRARIFEPLGMKSTQIRSDFRALLPNRAYSYDPRKGGGFQHAVLSMALPGPTAVQTTVEDMARWNQNFDDMKVGGKAVMEEMLRVGKFNDGKDQDYAGGLIIGNYRGLKTVSHTGVDAGYRAVFLRFPDEHFTVVCLANLGSIVPAKLAKKVADIYLKDQLKPVAAPATAPENPAAPGDPQQYDDYAGTYWLAGDDLARTFVREGDRLMLKLGEAKLPLKEVTAGDFVEEGGGTHYIFSKSADGKIHDMKRQMVSSAPTTAKKIEAGAPLPRQQMIPYTGYYRSTELDCIYQIQIENGQLMLTHRKDKASIIPMGGDAFMTQFDQANRDYGDYVGMAFTRDGKNNIDGFTFASERVKHLRFKRIEIADPGKP